MNRWMNRCVDNGSQNKEGERSDQMSDNNNQFISEQYVICIVGNSK